MPTGKIIRNRADCYNRETYRTLIDIFSNTDCPLTFLELHVLLNPEHHKRYSVYQKNPQLEDLEKKLRLNNVKRSITKQNLNYFLRSLIDWNWIEKDDGGYRLLPLVKVRETLRTGDPVFFTPQQVDNILRRYTDLRIAKEWLSKLTRSSYKEVQQELDRRQEKEYGVQFEKDDGGD